MSSEEVSMLVHHTDSLHSYTRRSDCFGRAAQLIRSRCGEVAMGEDERVNAAIAMTLCELSTAKHYSPPLECSLFLSDEAALTSSNAQSDCVEALSRSAQYWSSYSGYLREVPQLCYAFRRWNDIDAARDIYQNISREKLDLLNVLWERETRFQSIHDNSEQALLDLRMSIAEMRSFSTETLTAVNAVTMDIRASHQEMSQSLRDAIFQFLEKSADAQLTIVEQIDATLRIVVRHVCSAVAEYQLQSGEAT
ncbi:hypothetical protein OBBRIDRAFT_377458 [Obba rivulosa]|uniref:Uncharacterized protein n=1 Tax=Obba rivulosa TaxID=1052685 RepID=A0A8E2AT38_9APHY|nr:hypothetical protein OBBRIDRAFT_377458 [Obba rivulosa]